jgi:hypothetical protein
VSLNEERQNILDPHYSEKSARFHSKYKIKLKHKYNNRKILNTIQVMLRNIHPNPDKRMTPQETKAFFVSIFYECWFHFISFHTNSELEWNITTIII